MPHPSTAVSSGAQGGQSSTATELVVVEELAIQFRRGGRPVPALRGVSFEVGRGEIVALVGESGSGKTVLGMTLLGLLPDNPGPTVRGVARVDGVDMARAKDMEKRRVRRESLGVVFQDPMSSLNPTMRIGDQIAEAAGPDGLDTATLLDMVRLDFGHDRLNAYPHQLSGGQRQRVMLAMAIARNPALVIADEPTTALDVTVQAEILRLIRRLRDEVGSSFLFVTHDLGVAAEVADRVVVMYAGRIAESGPADVVLSRPRHPYTASLLESRIGLGVDRSRPLPTIRGRVPSPHDLPPGCPFAPRCSLHVPACDAAIPDLRLTDMGTLAACIRSESVAERDTIGNAEPSWPPSRLESSPRVAVQVTGVRKEFASGRGVRRQSTVALEDIDLTVDVGESVALVGESGSGKSTLLRIVAGLITPDQGTVTLHGGSGAQMIFQDAASSLTPWLSVGSLLNERLRKTVPDKSQRRRRVLDTLHLVGLSADVLKAQPRQLSGGQAQRVAIARAVIEPPAVLLADEPTSALDVSLAANVLNLLGRLRRELSLSMLFVTHDLAAARVVADRVVVMNRGRVVEIGIAEQVIHEPQDPYTRALVDAVPGGARLAGVDDEESGRD